MKKAICLDVSRCKLADVNNFCVLYGTELSFHNGKPIINLIEVEI